MIVAAVHVVEAVNEFIGVGVPAADRDARPRRRRRHGGGARWRSARAGCAGSDASAAAPPSQRWATLLRTRRPRSSGSTLLVSVLVGFIAFAAFLVEQLIAVAGTLELLYVLLILTEEGFGALTTAADAGRPGPVGRAGPARRTGSTRSPSCSSGVIKVALYVVAVLLVLAPWRIESGDMLATVEAAFFGFSIGGATISISSLHRRRVLLFVAAIGGTRAVQRWLEAQYLPHTKLDTGPAELDRRRASATSASSSRSGLALAYLGPVASSG